MPMKERLSQLWLFALLNYLYADVVALFAMAANPAQAPHLNEWALAGSAVLMEIPIAMRAVCVCDCRCDSIGEITAGFI